MTSQQSTEQEHEVLQTLSTVEQLTRGEIDTQIATAKRYPRSIKKFINEATEMACLDEETASECIYALPRDGKSIEGPSARLAEILSSAWGNCRAGARVIGEDDQFVTSQGAFFDLERNVAITYEVKRRITDKNGRRYKPDMIGVTANAACSIALRNAVLKGIPKAYWKRIYDGARQAAIGDAKTLASKRADMMAYFAKMGVLPEQIFTLLSVKGVEDVTLDHMATLKGIATAIKEGDTTIEQAFAVAKSEVKMPAPVPEPPQSTTAEQPASELEIPEGCELLTETIKEVKPVKLTRKEDAQNGSYKKGDAYHKFDIITESGAKISTFDEKRAAQADNIRKKGWPAKIVWKPSGAYKNFVSIQ